MAPAGVALSLTDLHFDPFRGLSPVNGVTLATLFRQLGAPGPARGAYIRDYNVGHTADPPIIERTWPVFWCAIGHLTAAAFQACAGRRHPDRTESAANAP